MDAILENCLSLVSSSQIWTLLIVALGVYLVSTWTYNLFFHPLAGFPGPKLAAASRWYEFYYDVIKRGQYVYKIEEMHKSYGPILRINPYEIVINDPDFYNEVYVAGNTRRTGIWPRYRTGIGFDDSHTMTENHELHRRRRKPLEPFFSRMGIARMEEMIISEAKLLSDRLESMKGSKTVIRLDHVFSAFAGDVIGKICCETPPSMMKNPEFGKEWHDLIERVVRQLLLFMHIPQLVTLARLFPTSLLQGVYPGAAGFNEFRQMMARHIVESKRENAEGKHYDENASNSIFRYIVTSDMPPSEQSVERLSREAMVLFGAGTATTARTMGFMCYYILRDPAMRKRLGDELASLMADYPAKSPRWAELEKLPYLQALIKEGLRLSYGVMRRLPRTSPDVALNYKQWTIPKGTPVGMGAYSLHTDPDVYPEPFKFIPERWLGDYDPRMNRNWVPFSRGSRNCLGINLANAEMNHAMAVLFRPGGPKLSLYETDESDIAQAVDFLMPLPKLDSRGTRVMIE
ncbi:putative cytochrome P450, putative EED11494.1 cytochrome P450 [Rhypophila decipiens]|uniref:Cytochrome P450, putative EED11494.1 cytochrome P450 n=1 Tax=Rhypophila decipiens TaxID=261697 RepID=A0AAN7B0R0_9PEZI|nr:putative cytochrome P450, putative EED11494.1 cytochrome P450 [Rhypophila decipiens]